jgi:hypothetical protein
MKPPASPLRWLRAGVLGGSAVALSAAGHIAGGGHAEPVLLLLLGALAALGAYGWLRTERGLVSIVGAVAVVQLAAHLVLSAGHAHAGSSAMLGAHAVAGLLLAALLRRGEARIFAAARRRYLQWRVAVRTALAGLPTLLAVPQPPVVGRTPDLTRWIHSAVHGRAPPVAAVC